MIIISKLKNTWESGRTGKPSTIMNETSRGKVYFLRTVRAGKWKIYDVLKAANRPISRKKFNIVFDKKRVKIVEFITG